MQRKLALVLAFLLDGYALGPRPVDAKGGEETTAAFFAPGGAIEPAIRDMLNGAKKEAIIAMYLFTSRDLSDAVIKAKKRGVDVRVILDGDQKSVRHGKYADV